MGAFFILFFNYKPGSTPLDLVGLTEARIQPPKPLLRGPVNTVLG